MGTRAIVLLVALGLATCKPAVKMEGKQEKKAAAAVPQSASRPAPQTPTKEDRRRRTVEVYEAREVEASTVGIACRAFKGRCFSLLTAAPAMTINDFTFEITKDRTLSISLSPVEADQLARITRGMARPTGEARRLALIHQGKILHVPKVRAEITTGKIRVSFCDKSILDNFRRLKKK